ncbi:hypothetical protein [Streptosporangium sp. NPDC051022]|uniref:hypothetical protein n=1 Tax=Streptosporangium sp. NPDC051022 TaxID=3155752 RepID=UPI003413E42C
MMDTPDRIPARYVDLVALHGPALGVEQARPRWGPLVRAAEDGTPALITREHWEWAALVPLTEVAEPLAELPAWPLSEARAKLGTLVRQVTGLTYPAVLLTRHRTPVAALIDARRLAARPAPADRLAVEDLLRQGCEVTLSFDPGQDGWVSEDGDVLDEPYDPFYVAIARDHQGAEVATGYGDSVAEALLCLRGPYPEDPTEFSDVPPF